MIKKKNKFFTFVFSLFPGAGHMYMGFMKAGCSLLSLFSFIIFLGSWLNLGPVLFILPIVWFYAFFDCINKMSLSDNEFSYLKDDYLFDLDKIFVIGPDIIKKNRTVLAIIFIYIGFTILWNNFVGLLYGIMPSFLMNMIYGFTNSLPQLVFAFFIIYIGVKLILGKKSDLDKEFHSKNQEKILGNTDHEEMN